MAEFGAAATLDVQVPDRELRAARREIESELGDVTVSVDASARTVRTDGGGPIGTGGVGQQTVQLQQVELLGDIHEELELIGQELAAGGGGGGGGGSGGLLGALGLTRLLGGAGGSAGGGLGLAGLASGVSATGALAAGTAAAPLAAGHFVNRAHQTGELGRTQAGRAGAVKGVAGNPMSLQDPETLKNFLGLGGSPELDESKIPRLQPPEGPWPPTIPHPDWLDQPSAFREPEWVEQPPTFQTPEWVRNPPTFGQPDWVQDPPAINVEPPDWMADLFGGQGGAVSPEITLQMDAPQLQLSPGNIEQAVRRALDRNFAKEVADLVEDRVRQEIGGF